MNNSRYIAIQKAASWKGNDSMINVCVNEFNRIKDADTLQGDTKESAIECARSNGICKEVLIKFIT